MERKIKLKPVQIGIQTKACSNRHVVVHSCPFFGSGSCPDILWITGFLLGVRFYSIPVYRDAFICIAEDPVLDLFGPCEHVFFLGPDFFTASR